ncbi:MAG: RHS repeat protein [Bacteroidales bacterium]|nr:RHS repeat protein [Bacteroidales bacterium]
MKQAIVPAIFVALFLSLCDIAYSQTEEQTLLPSMIPNIPTSPQASAFVRLGEYKAENAYGMPDISIPLFTADFHGYQIPFNLHYEARPLRPGYNYDVYGLGWTLSGNSCVARTIMDRADEYGDSKTAFRVETFRTSDGKDMKKFISYRDQHDLMKYHLEWIDTKLDSYKIVLPSGRTIPFFMYMDENNKLKFDLLSIDRNIKISCKTSSKSIDSFLVIDESGIRYTFDIADKVSNVSKDPNTLANIAWHLSRIEIPGKGTISYQYNTQIKWYEPSMKEPILRITRLYPIDFVPDALAPSKFPKQGSGQNSYCCEYNYLISLNKINQSPLYHLRLLKSIKYNNVSIEFEYKTDNRHIKVITLNDSSKKQTYNLDIDSQSKLNNLIIGSDESKLKYSFTYTSKDPGECTDHWGNYGQSFTPEDIGNFNICVDNRFVQKEEIELGIHNIGNRILLLDRQKDDITAYFKLKLQSSNGGDSRCATSPEKHCVLRSITYPNGGSTWFTFENHKFLTASSADGHLEPDRTKQRMVEGGGFRIKNIINYDANNKEVSRDEYCYGYIYNQLSYNKVPFPVSSTQNMDEYTGCGEAVVDPNVLTYMNYDYSTSTIPSGFLSMITGRKNHTGFMDITLIDETAWWWNATFCASNFRQLLGDRQAVVYPQITIFHGGLPSSGKCIGKTELKYDIYRHDYVANVYYLCQLSDTPKPYTAYFECIRYADRGGTVLVCDEKPEKANQLISKTLYSHISVSATCEWIPVSSEEYTYNEYIISKRGWTYNNAYAQSQCLMTKAHMLSHSVGKDEDFIYLIDFYSTIDDRKGTSKLASKKIKKYSMSSSTPFTMQEKYSYVYGSQISSKNYWDIADKQDMYTYVGETQSSNAAIDSLKAKNMLAFPTSALTNTTTYSGPIKTAGNQIDYGFYGKNGKYSQVCLAKDDNIYPHIFYEYNGSAMEKSIEVLSYSPHGNPTEVVDLKTGLHTAYIWGYDDRYVIAEISGATYDSAKSYIDTSNPTIDKLNAIREKLPNAMIRTWEYVPLKGVVAHTNVQGQTFRYEYDDLGRLTKEIRIGGNKEKEAIKSYEYNYKN